MKFVLTGPKCSGKSKIGHILADSLSLPFYETDLMIEVLFREKQHSDLSCRAICDQYGEDFFRNLEREVIENVSKFDNCVISTGGSTMLNKDSRQSLRFNSVLILVTASIETLLKRLSDKEIPTFLNNKTAKDLFSIKASLVTEVIKPYADIIIDSSNFSFEETFDLLVREIMSFLLLSHLENKESVKFLGSDEKNGFVFGISGDAKKSINPSCVEVVLKDLLGLSATVCSEHPFLITVKLNTPSSTGNFDVFRKLLPIEKQGSLALQISLIRKAISIALSDKKNIMTSIVQSNKTPVEILKFALIS